MTNGWVHLTAPPARAAANRWLGPAFVIVLIGLGALWSDPWSGRSPAPDTETRTALDARTQAQHWSDAALPAPPPVDIPIQNIAQETDVWCWVAVAKQIIAKSRGATQTPSQCALVSTANGWPAPTCCRPNAPPDCIRPGTLEEIEALIQRFGGRATRLAPPTDPMTLYATLSRGKPVILSLQVEADMGHVVVVRGMSFQSTPNGLTPVLHINDPMARFTQPATFDSIVRIWRAAIIVD